MIYLLSIQEKYEAAAASLAEMEKRVVMAESMLEATLQYQSGQIKAQPSPRYLLLLADYHILFVRVKVPISMKKKLITVLF